MDQHLKRAVPQYVVEHFVDKVNNPENPLYEVYDPVREALKEINTAKNVSFYTFGPIGELVREARREGIAIMPLGAGGPGAVPG